MAALQEDRDPGRVREMFGGIAPRYDLLNRVLSLSFDQYWRRRAARALALSPSSRVLDLCAGTGDLTVAAARAEPDAFLVACDFSMPMLSRARPKLERRRLADRCVLTLGDGLRLPFRDGSFEGAVVGFGIRNFADLAAGLAEIRRVLRPAGTLVVLEFSRPRGRALGAAYRVYLNRVVPRLGDATAGRTGPYGYLARTIGAFPEPAALAGTIREAGFAGVGWTTLTGGIVCIHKAFRGD